MLRPFAGGGNATAAEPIRVVEDASRVDQYISMFDRLASLGRVTREILFDDLQKRS